MANSAIATRPESRPGIVEWLSSRAAFPFSPLLPCALLLACAHGGSEVGIDRERPDAAEPLAIEARARCTDRSDDIPPRAFESDGCSAFPDGDWAQCCVEHDVEYWCGGTADERKRADARLSACVAESGHSILGPFMYAGVRMGGAPWWPVPWRWGFGWDFPHGYDPSAPEDDSKSVTATRSEPEKEAN